MTAKLWSIYSVENNTFVNCVATLTEHTGYVRSVAFHPTLPILATSSRDKTAKLWRFSLDGVLPVSCVATLNNDEPIFSVAFHPNKNILAIGSSDKTTKLLNFSLDGETSSFTELETLNGHTGDVKSVVFSTDGTFLATASDDKTTILWRM
jgi:WD40 repeat protein